MNSVCPSIHVLAWRILTLALAFGNFTPARAALSPCITNITLLETGEIKLQLEVEKGQSYTFEISTNLINWEAVGGIENASTNLLTVVDEEGIGSSQARFYRMHVGKFTRSDFWFMHFAQAGHFEGASWTPAVAFPVAFNGYRAVFEVEGSAPYPPPGEVFLTGPPGSGVSSVPAGFDETEVGESVAEYWFPNLVSTFGAPVGNWTVIYRGTNTTYALGFQPLSRLTLPVPTVVIEGGILKSVHWVFRDRVSGETPDAPPAYLKNIQVQVDGQNGRLCDSPEIGDLSQTTFDLSSPVAWTQVRAINMVYDDFDGNHYVIFFWRQ